MENIRFSVILLFVLLFVFSGNVKASSRVFYENFEDGNADNFDIHTADIVTFFPHSGNYCGRANWTNPQSKSNFIVNAWDYENETFIRFWIRIDPNSFDGSGQKILRLGFEQGSNMGNSDTFHGLDGIETSPHATNFWYVDGKLVSQCWNAGELGTEWSKYEIYIKHDTDNTDGVIKVWIDDNLSECYPFVGDTFDGEEKWFPFHFPSNCNYCNSNNNFIYIDDVEIFSDKDTGEPTIGSMENGTIEVITKPIITSVEGNFANGKNFTITGEGFGLKVNAAPFRSSYDNPNKNMNFQEIGILNDSYWSTPINEYHNNFISLQESMRRTNLSSHKFYIQMLYRENGTGSGIRVYNIPLSGKHYFAWWDYLDSGINWSRMKTGTASIKYVYLNAGGHPHEGIQIMQDGKVYGSCHGGIEGETIEQQNTNLVLPYGGGFYARPISWVTNYKLPLDKWYFVELLYKINTAPGIYDGWYEFRVNNQLIWRANNCDIYDPDYSNNYGFEDICLGGNYDWYGGEDIYYRYYGDIYIDNTFARVVIGDAPNYQASRHLELQIPISWSDNSITFTVNQGSFSNGSQVYLYVINENGEISNGYPVIISSTLNYPNCSEDGVSSSNQQQDTTPPVLSSSKPTGALPRGTTETTISLTTNEPAICKYSRTPNTNYQAMQNIFSITGGTTHSHLITGLQDNTTYNFYVRCKDNYNNINTNDYLISFFVNSIHGQGGQCIHPHADKPPCDGKISIKELIDYINNWKNSQCVTISEVLEVINLWKREP